MDIQAKIQDLINDIEADLLICKKHFENSDGNDDEFFRQKQVDLIRFKTITDILTEIAKKL